MTVRAACHTRNRRVCMSYPQPFRGGCVSCVVEATRAFLLCLSLCELHRVRLYCLCARDLQRLALRSQLPEDIQLRLDLPSGRRR